MVSRCVLESNAMYTPAHNKESDRAKIIAFLREYPFATLVTSRGDKLTATHLPVLVDERDAELVLVAHLARANTQWADFSEHDALMIFQEPHAFISTRHYERPLSVPTWNYVAVHAYGVPKILDRVAERLAVVARMTEYFEGNLDQWNALPQDFKETKAKGIVAFEMPVTRLDARFKLSQDRTETEREHIIQALAERDDVEATIGEMMRERATVQPS